MTATPTAPSRFVWQELMTRDVPAAREFYTTLLGWTMGETHVAPDGTPYHFLRSGEKTVAGLMALPAEATEVPPNWTPYISVADVDAAAAQVAELGGKVLHGPIDVEGWGRMVVIADDQGAVVNLVATNAPMPERDGMFEAGEFCWYSLAVPDLDRGARFYTALTGWTAQAADVGGGDVQTVFLRDGQYIAGLTPIPSEGHPSYWGLAVAVRELDALHARALELGARELVPPSPVGTMGRMFVVADPTGAVLSYFEGAPQESAAE